MSSRPPLRWRPGHPRPLRLADAELASTPNGTAVTLTARPKARTVATRLAPGIYTHGPDAYRFFARIKGTLHSTVFRPQTPLALIAVKEAYRGWRSTVLEDGGSATTPERGTFADDVATYLSRVTAMVSYQTKKHHLEAFVAELGGDRPRASITATEIDRVLQKWLREGYAVKTVKLRRDDLAQVWGTLDGKHAPNPARQTTLPPTPPLEPRGMLAEHVQAVFAAMPVSKTKIRLWIMATIGLPQKQIKELTIRDIDLANRRIRTQARRKGAGAVGGWRPIAPAAVEALKAFILWDCFGKFNNAGMRLVWRRGCQKSGIPGHWRPYDLRHSFGTWVYAATGDLSSTADLLGHAKTETARRYTMGARMLVAKRATELVQIPGLGAKVTTPAAPEVSQKFQGSDGSPDGSSI